MWLMEEASMMSVMNGWSSIRIPVAPCGQGNTMFWSPSALGMGLGGDEEGSGPGYGWRVCHPGVLGYTVES